MKKTKSCGFTIIELVIVIAVIAILSAVLIPTFGGVMESAQNSTRDTKAKNAYTDYITYHPIDDNSYLIIEIRQSGATYYYSVTDGQIDLDHESKVLSAIHGEGIKCKGYVVYPTSANALWQERWNAMVVSDTIETNEASIIYSDFFSSILATIYDKKTVKKENLFDFVEYFKSKEITFTEVNCDDEEYRTAGKCRIILSNNDSSDSDFNEENRDYYICFAISSSGYIFSITKSSARDPFFTPYGNGTVLKSETPIDVSVIENYFENYAE